MTIGFLGMGHGIQFNSSARPSIHASNSYFHDARAEAARDTDAIWKNRGPSLCVCNNTIVSDGNTNGLALQESSKVTGTNNYFSVLGIRCLGVKRSNNQNVILPGNTLGMIQAVWGPLWLG